MRILLLAYFYPPYQAAGASRAGQLVAGWRAAGADVTVLAATPSDTPRFGPLDDDVVWTRPFEVNALPRLVTGRSVVETGFAQTGNRSLMRLGGAYKQLVNFPDGQIGWYRVALRTARRLIAERAPDVIVSTSPPATAHLVARALHRDPGAPPWIAEFRDPWTRNPNFRRWAPLRAIEERMESSILRAADAIVGVTPGLARQYAESGRQVHVITNGFTPSDYPSPGALDDDLLLHIGTVYPTYDFDMLFAALRAAARPPSVRFVGRNLGPLRTALASAGPVPVVTARPVARSEALAQMTRAWANLAFIYRAPDGGIQGEYVQQKFYEYLGARRPIVVVGPRAGEGADLLAASGLAAFARDETELRRLFDDRSWASRAQADPEALERYAYPVIARRYLEVMEEVIARRTRAR